jgi:hypothetical protein
MTGGTVEDSLASRAGRLFAEYRDGDHAKMGDLVRVLTPILWHTARAARLDSATAEDVLQTVWLTLIRKSDTITEPRAVLHPRHRTPITAIRSRTLCSAMKATTASGGTSSDCPSVAGCCSE